VSPEGATSIYSFALPGLGVFYSYSPGLHPGLNYFRPVGAASVLSPVIPLIFILILIHAPSARPPPTAHCSPPTNSVSS